jgi:hypothetical protein
MRKDICKKISALILGITMITGLTACGSSSATKNEQEVATNVAAEVIDETIVEDASTETIEEQLDATDEEETAIFNGKEYVKIYTIVCDSSLSTVDSQFDQYFREGTAEDGVHAIVKAGNVFVNGQQIPYMKEDGTLSSQKLVVNGEDAIWEVDGGWAWKAHLQRQWDDGFFMPNVEENYTPGEPVDFDTAEYLYTKYIAYMVGQNVDLYAEVGDEYASLISTTYYNSTLVADIETSDGITHITDSEGNVLDVDFPSENFDENIKPEDMMVFWEDGEKGWTAKRAVSVVGRLVENTDPTDEDAIKHPYFLPDGESETITTGDSYIGKSFAEAFRHTQFIRGERRTDQYNNEDEVIIMWSSDEGQDHVIGFTRGDGAYTALVHAIEYAQEVTKDVVVSVDGSDVASDKYWVTEEIWNDFETKLEEAKALADSGTATNFECDTMLFELGNVLGGTEDLHSNSPMKMNPLGVVGSMEQGKE